MGLLSQRVHTSPSCLSNSHSSQDGSSSGPRTLRWLGHKVVALDQSSCGSWFDHPINLPKDNSENLRRPVLWNPFIVIISWLWKNCLWANFWCHWNGWIDRDPGARIPGYPHTCYDMIVFILIPQRGEQEVDTFWVWWPDPRNCGILVKCHPYSAGLSFLTCKVGRVRVKQHL